jgi:hypothetical protein
MIDASVTAVKDSKFAGRDKKKKKNKKTFM